MRLARRIAWPSASSIARCLFARDASRLEPRRFSRASHRSSAVSGTGRYCGPLRALTPRAYASVPKPAEPLIEPADDQPWGMNYLADIDPDNPLTALQRGACGHRQDPHAPGFAGEGGAEADKAAGAGSFHQTPRDLALLGLVIPSRVKKRGFEFPIRG